MTAFILECSMSTVFSIKLIASSKDLVFSKEVHKSAQAFWFEASKAKNKESWIRGAEKVIKRELNK